MHIGLQIPSFKYPGGTAAIRPKLKEIVTTAEASGFYSLWVMDHFYFPEIRWQGHWIWVAEEPIQPGAS